MRRPRTFFPLWAVSLILAACSTVPSVDVDDADRARLHQKRAAQLAEFPDWTLAGRLAVSNEHDGGSGRFSWVRRNSGSRMDFHGALGRGAWRLTADDAGARLELADGTVHNADSIDILVRSQVGWDIPVDSLSWWVRGLAAPGVRHEPLIDDQGNLQELQQGGWTVTYGRYRSFGGVSLPVRLSARQADWKVKLAIRSWEMPARNGADD